MKLRKIELEITSDCNAACPGCARTLKKELLQINAFTLQDLQRIFPPADYNGVEFKFCGVLGDPAKHNECVEMVDYLSAMGGYCELSTNGAYQTANWWERLGKIAYKRPGLVFIHFCVDGHEETNHIYRVNTKWKVLDRNMQAFSNYAPIGSASWIYIIFDHNEHELDKARVHAESLGFSFATRTGMRNSYHNWVSTIAKKDKELKKVVVEKKTITTSGAKEHSKKKEVKELDKFIQEYKARKKQTQVEQKNEVFEEKKKDILKSIICKYIHEQEVFIASNLTLWPCCFLWDSAFKNSENIVQRLNKFEPNWNSLKHHSIDKILQHDWYKQLLGASWDPSHELHFSRCIKTCAKNKAYHNEFNYENA